MYKSLKTLQDIKINASERWVYSVGFNVSNLQGHEPRILDEITDLNKLLNAGAKVSLISHHEADQIVSAQKLSEIAKYLTQRLSKRISFYPNIHDSSAITVSEHIKSGEAVLFGNTRTNPNEQIIDPGVSQHYSRLGNKVLVGGFCKAHRMHSSNIGILDYLPGYLSASIVKAIELISPWSIHVKSPHSCAILGGTKKEKVLFGLKSLISFYDIIIPGGVVLNTILHESGIDMADSVRLKPHEHDLLFLHKILSSELSNKILLPNSLLVRSNDDFPRYQWLKLSKINAIPKNHYVIDFAITNIMKRELLACQRDGGRVLFSGTPSDVNHNKRHAGHVLSSLIDPKSKANIFLGGDTVQDMNFHGLVCAGGGASLVYLCDGTLPVLEKLEMNQKRFKL